MEIKRICLFDQGLGIWTGHWINFHNSIRAEALSRGLQYIVFGHKRIDPGIVGDLPVRPLFTDLPWTDLTGDQEVDYRDGSRNTMADLTTIDERFSPHDLLFFLSLTAQSFAGFVRFGARVFRDTGARPALFAQS